MTKPPKQPKEPDFLADLDDLAKDLLKAAKKPDETLEMKLEIFKFCTQYYVNTQKVKKKQPVSGGMTMDSLRARAQGAIDDDHET